MNKQEMLELEAAIEHITGIAKDFGLDFFPMRYEICPADIIYTFGAYGMPTRFSHWSFGKAFYRMKTQYDLGLSKIYELVINSNPCYAFLLEGNSLIQNKLIVAHVLAHCDFFKNNARFRNTNRDMVETMSATAERIRKYEMEYGIDKVETFLDAVLGIQEHIDPSVIRPKQNHPAQESKPASKKTSEYDDLWALDEFHAEKITEPTDFEVEPFPAKPEKDLLLFIEAHSTVLKDWQRDIITMLRDEMLYFWPQIETKIMNEGWASYWHIRIMRELDLTSEETIEYAKLNSGVVQPSTHSLNPYYLGLKIFEDIEERWGREKMFEVRELDSDISFLRNYLTKELVEDLDLYVFEKQGPEWKITDKAWENVRDQLVFSKVNGGFPYLTVTDGNYNGQGELYLLHSFEGIELDLKYIEKTLPYVYRLWGKPIHLETTVEQKPVLFSYDGKKCHRKFM
ncbi:SpoVR family protein [Marinicrinis lubricantis]|uniref:SpoVR family protein n=1 Tax=Marinicrinis lubricantis TaxID=2086470 RepID=A0ABW1IQ49_9BACL